jgi:hypothetical protein
VEGEEDEETRKAVWTKTMHDRGHGDRRLDIQIFK